MEKSVCLLSHHVFKTIDTWDEQDKIWKSKKKCEFCNYTEETKPFGCPRSITRICDFEEDGMLIDRTGAIFNRSQCKNCGRTCRQNVDFAENKFGLDQIKNGMVLTSKQFGELYTQIMSTHRVQQSPNFQTKLCKVIITDTKYLQGHPGYPHPFTQSQKNLSITIFYKMKNDL